MKEHTTHFLDCGCLTALAQELIIAINKIDWVKNPARNINDELSVLFTTARLEMCLKNNGVM